MVTSLADLQPTVSGQIPYSHSSREATATYVSLVYV